ncbi:aspartyl protease family protein [Acidomonas methanolica]|uniref:aspartyl protease family protein n=1 Tax=Acidomonas methanolica TaxID=437 RepID=UPI00211A5AA1|nr:aspartyl protease family protein [Acidomonas methanolica]MCQ9156521.1 retroviral-like aspartic protease family protein [Acidomonas methanolica]
MLRDVYRLLKHTVLCWPLLLVACADDGLCKISTLGNLSVLNNRSFPIVKATINERPVAFIVDTGSRFSNIWPNEVEKLGLESRSERVLLRGIGGETMGGVAVADSVGLGSGKATNVTFVTAGNLFDGRSVDGLPVVGLLGADFLSNYDVVFDLPNHRITLLQIEGCKDWHPAWQGSFFKVSVDHGWRDDTKIVVHLKLNNHPIDAFLDSGASTTIISRSDALDSGVTKSMLAEDRKGMGFGIDDEKTVRYLHRFETLQMGPFRFHRPVLHVAKTDNSLLGADFLRHHRVWIPRYEDWIYVQASSMASANLTSPHTTPATN